MVEKKDISLWSSADATLKILIACACVSVMAFVAFYFIEQKSEYDAASHAAVMNLARDTIAASRRITGN